MKNTLENIIREQNDQVLFAYLFGSQAQENTSFKSDIDIAVYLKKEVTESPFAVKTRLYVNISKALKRNDIDLVILNTCQNMMLLDQVIRYGHVIYCADDDKRMEFEVLSLHRAIDFKHQRRMAMGV